MIEAIADTIFIMIAGTIILSLIFIPFIGVLYSFNTLGMWGILTVPVWMFIGIFPFVYADNNF